MSYIKIVFDHIIIFLKNIAKMKRKRKKRKNLQSLVNAYTNIT